MRFTSHARSPESMLSALTLALLLASGAPAAAAQLDAKHAALQVDCAGCHGTAVPGARPKTEDCLRCHKSYEAVAARTAQVKPNPHESHLGEIRCTLCHRAHAEPVFYCDRCHSFGLAVR
ncbi:MAG: cytochrome c3 family protein [Candidatus Methylomirabilales bacterium]